MRCSGEVPAPKSKSSSYVYFGWTFLSPLHAHTTLQQTHAPRGERCHSRLGREAACLLLGHKHDRRILLACFLHCKHRHDETRPELSLVSKQLGVLKLLYLLLAAVKCCDNSMRKKDWRCRKHGTQPRRREPDMAISPRRSVSRTATPVL